jgi:hypothetical protein
MVRSGLLGYFRLARNPPLTRAIARGSAKALHIFGLLRVAFVPRALNSFAILAGPISQFCNSFSVSVSIRCEMPSILCPNSLNRSLASPSSPTSGIRVFT